MALYLASFDVAGDLETAFDYIADFANAALWDPSVSRGVRLSEGDPRLGSRFEVDVSFLGATTTMTYEITRWERPHLVILESKTPFVDSCDEITLTASDGGVHVSYAARLTLSGVLKLADPGLQLLFNASGDQSRDGLAKALRNLRTGG
jgi:carbon monoxide dehydrogenase subunit G